MIKRILVTQDGSDYGDTAQKYALWLAERFGASLTGVHVVDMVALEGPFLHDLSGSLGFEPYLNFSTRMREVLESRGKSILDSFAESCKEAGVDHSTELAFGVVANEICEKARLADLIVVGRRGMNAEFEYGLLGSVTEGVVRKSPKPVLVTPAEFTEPQKPLLAYDGSENSSKAMHSAAEWASALGLPLTVLHASREAERDQVMEEARNYLKPYDVEAEYKNVEDDPPVGIEKEYKNGGHDLLFMGTSHHSRIVEMVLGSTTEYVLRAVPGPFFLER